MRENEGKKEDRRKIGGEEIRERKNKTKWRKEEHERKWTRGTT